MARKVFLGAIVLVVFSISSVFADSQSFTIQMTANGFKPQESTLYQNFTVSFINSDTIDHWPASDIHPTHDLYPEFDPTRPVAPGSSWQFTPQKVGNWKFHDHLHPHVKGVLIVKKAKAMLPQHQHPSLTEIIRQAFASLFGNNSQPVVSREDFKDKTQRQQLAVLQDMAEKKGVAKAWKYLNIQFAPTDGSSGNVHDLAHYVGGLIFQQKGLDGLNVCTRSFAFGCYHGFLDRAFQNNLDTIDKAIEACKKVGKENSGPFASCVHGIGHGVASFYQTSNLNHSLLVCSRLKAGQSFCYDGVFMEFARNASADFYKVNDPLYPCNTLAQKYSSACGRNIPSILFGRFHLSFENAVKQCQIAANQDLKLSCFDALGFTVTSWSKGSAQYIIDSCNTVEDSTFRSHCLTAGAGELVFQDIKDWKDSSVKVCQALFGNDKKKCDEYIWQIIKDYAR